MDKPKKCKGYREGKFTCKYGFNQSKFSICDGENLTKTPQCCNVELCGKLYNKTNGVPIVYDY